jgi:cytidylate kinase
MGICLDGRDITYKILPNADFKFFLTADIESSSKKKIQRIKKNK